MPAKEVQEIELDIPISKINDSAFIQEQFLTVGFNLCRKLSDFGEKSFIELVNEFIPEQEGITDTFLQKWGLTKSQINLKTKQMSTTVNTLPIEEPTATTTTNLETSLESTTKKATVKKTPVKKTTVKKMTVKKTTTKKAVNKAVANESDVVIANTSDEKPVPKKKKKRKITVKKPPRK